MPAGSSAYLPPDPGHDRALALTPGAGHPVVAVAHGVAPQPTALQVGRTGGARAVVGVHPVAHGDVVQRHPPDLAFPLHDRILSTWRWWSSARSDTCRRSPGSR